MYKKLYIKHLSTGPRLADQTISHITERLWQMTLLTSLTAMDYFEHAQDTKVYVLANSFYFLVSVETKSPYVSNMFSYEKRNIQIYAHTCHEIALPGCAERHFGFCCDVLNIQTHCKYLFKRQNLYSLTFIKQTIISETGEFFIGITCQIPSMFLWKYLVRNME